MNSSRDWGDRIDSVDPQLGRDQRQRLWRASAAAVILLALAGTAVAVVRFLSSASPALVDQAREDLQRAAAREPKSSQRLQLAANAEQHLREYGAPQPGASTANLLLAAALAVQSVEAFDAPVQKGAEFEEILFEIQPGQCGMEDLALAADLFRQTGKHEPANWVAQAGLKSSAGSNTEHRASLLRTAISVSYALGQEAQVVEQSRELAQLQPQDPFPLRMTAQVYEDLGVPDAVIEAYRKLLAVEDAPATRRKLAERLLETGQAAEARQQIEWLQQNAAEVVQEYPMLLGELLLLEGKPESAAEIADQTLQKSPENEAARLLKSRVLLAQQQYPDAIELLTKVVENDRSHTQAHYLLGMAYARMGDRAAGQKHLDLQRRYLDIKVRLHKLERTAGQNASDVETKLQIANLYRELGYDEQAQYWLNAARAANR